MGHPECSQQRNRRLAGLIWKQKVAKGELTTVAANYLVEEEHAPDSDGATGGVFGIGANTTVQLATVTKNGALPRLTATDSAIQVTAAVTPAKLAVAMTLQPKLCCQRFWKPVETGFIPALSAGYG